jgi:hypothetical protein
MAALFWSRPPEYDPEGLIPVPESFEMNPLHLQSDAVIGTDAHLADPPWFRLSIVLSRRAVFDLSGTFVASWHQDMPHSTVSASGTFVKNESRYSCRGWSSCEDERSWVV